MPELFDVVPIAEALARLLAQIQPPGRVEHVPLEEALDRVTGARLHAPVDLPAFARSTMDGFAVRAADTYGASEGLPAYVTLCGEVPMGQTPTFEVQLGQAARIHTGGMLPPGADAVVMVEHTQALGEQLVEVVRPVAMGENVIPVGEDVRRGALLFPQGHRLRPQDLGGLAGVGVVSVPVAARPRVAVLATGDEIVPASEQPQPGQVRDINSVTVAALVRQAGGEALKRGIAPDDRAALDRMARAALDDADMLVISAGSSVSTRDMTAQVIAGLGSPGILVHGVAMHPGKPTILAVCDGKPVFGLPGNPVSTMIAFDLFVTPTIERMLGLIAENVEAEDQTTRTSALPASSRVHIHARLTQNIASHPGSEDFVQVRLIWRDGEWWAEPVFGKSNLIYTMARADGTVRVPGDAAGLYAGEVVTVQTA